MARLSSRTRRASLQDTRAQPALPLMLGLGSLSAAVSEQAAAAAAAAAGEAGWGSASVESQGASQGASQGNSQGNSQARSQGAVEGQGPGRALAAPSVMVLTQSRLRRGGRLAAAVRSLLYIPPQRASPASAALGRVRFCCDLHHIVRHALCAARR